VRFALGNVFPQEQEAFGSATARRASAEAADSVPGADRTTTDWQVGLAASWELDFWGVFRRSIESADAELGASIAEYDDALVLVLAEVASAFVLYRTFEERLVHVRANLAVQERSFELSREKFLAGAVTERDVQQARQVLEQTRSRVPPLEAGLRQASNALCVLLGSAPKDLSETLGANGAIPVVPDSVAIGIPADLLRRRPDVRRAERLAAAQSARIGVATGEYYPHFSISGTIGYRAEHFTDLFEGSSALAGAVGPSFRWNVLHYGRIGALVDAEEADFRVRVAEFQEAVLRAGQEADDAATLFLAAQDEASALADSVAAARRTVEITLDQYRVGAIDFTSVFLFQATLTEQEDSLAVSRGQIALELIALYRALGGGWEVPVHENP
jgi:NodT family efflux transporter outer membrane factor (OMF) lipoprotein